MVQIALQTEKINLYFYFVGKEGLIFSSDKTVFYISEEGQGDRSYQLAIAILAAI